MALASPRSWVQPQGLLGNKGLLRTNVIMQGKSLWRKESANFLREISKGRYKVVTKSDICTIFALYDPIGSSVWYKIENNTKLC